jgi:hypothetical protein
MSTTCSLRCSTAPDLRGKSRRSLTQSRRMGEVLTVVELVVLILLPSPGTVGGPAAA